VPSGRWSYLSGAGQPIDHLYGVVEVQRDSLAAGQYKPPNAGVCRYSWCHQTGRAGRETRGWPMFTDGQAGPWRAGTQSRPVARDVLPLPGAIDAPGGMCGARPGQPADRPLL